MIEAPNTKVELYRVTTGPIASKTGMGNNGAFIFPHFDKVLAKRLFFVCVVSDTVGWDHVSVTIRRQRDGQPDRIPTWEEMCFIKDLFFKEDEAAVQYHPAKQDYVNMHKFTLHLFRPQDQSLVTPPTCLIGLRPNQSFAEMEAEAAIVRAERVKLGGKDIPPEVEKNMALAFSVPTSTEGFDEILVITDRPEEDHARFNAADKARGLEPDFIELICK